MRITRNLIITTLFCCLITIGNIYVLLRFSNCKKQLNYSNKAYNLSNNRADKLKNYYIERSKKSIDSEGIYLSRDLFIEDLNQETIPLLDLVNDPFSLVFYFNESSCMTCIETEIQRLKENLSNEYDKVLILISGMSSHDVSYFQKQHHINFEVYIIDRDELPLPIKDFDIPFAFLLRYDGLIQSIFIPELYEKRLSNDYYNHIRKLFNENGDEFLD